MLFSIGVTEDAASGRAARPGGSALYFAKTLLGVGQFAYVDSPA